MKINLKIIWLLKSVHFDFETLAKELIPVEVEN